MLIDKSEEKQGKMIEGYCVESPEDMGSRIQVIIVTPRHAYPQVVEELSGRDITLLDLYQLLWIY